MGPRIPGSASQRWQKRRGELRVKILDYVRAHPRCTARDVACDVLRGPGHSRTTERHIAYAVLRELEDDGKVMRDRTEAEHVWSVAEVIHATA